VIAEVNNGGDLVESILRNIDPTVSFTAVRARRGKVLRAEPISALYERGLVHHVGNAVNFNELEDQMCSYAGEIGEKSPDRLDALVWALTELSEGVHDVSGGGADGLLG
jgi:phage terminase large subunit-like protein